MRQSGLEAAVLKAGSSGNRDFRCLWRLSDVRGNPFRSGWRGSGWNHERYGTASDGYRISADGKTRTRVSGTFGQVEGELSELSGVELEGYEIHMGVTRLHEGASPLTTIRDHATTTQEKQDGAYTSRVYGTYVHGVFDKEGVAEAVIRALGGKKGIDTTDMKGVDFQTFKETQYDILAAALREHLDMKKIYEILEEGV